VSVLEPLALGVLVSGSGTNLQAIIDAIASGQLNARVRVVISNVPDARALERAQRAGITAVCVSHKLYPTRESFDAAVVDVLLAHGVECVVLAGFMRIVTPVLLDAFADRVINVHPALLPAFPGVNAQAQALAYGVRVTGCTVHLVDAGMDTGPIVAQAAVTVLDDDDEASLRARILEQEHMLLVQVVQWFAERRVLVTRDAPGARARVRVVAVGGAMPSSA